MNEYSISYYRSNGIVETIELNQTNIQNALNDAIQNLLKEYGDNTEIIEIKLRKENIENEI